MNELMQYAPLLVAAALGMVGWHLKRLVERVDELVQDVTRLDLDIQYVKKQHEELKVDFEKVTTLKIVK